MNRPYNASSYNRHQKSEKQQRVEEKKTLIENAYENGRARGSYLGLARAVHDTLTTRMRQRLDFSREKTQEEQALAFLEMVLQDAVLVFSGPPVENQTDIIGDPNGQLETVSIRVPAGDSNYANTLPRDYIVVRAGGASYRGWEAQIHRTEDVEVLARQHLEDEIAEHKDTIAALKAEIERQQEIIDEFE